MKFLHAIFVFLLFMSAVMAADELIVNGTAVLGGKIPLKGFSIIQDPISGAGFCFKAPAGRSIGTDFIAIDPTKNYLLSGKFATQGKSGRFVLGFDCFDAKKRKIGAHHIQYVADTQTVLTANADKGSNHILIADGKNWSPAAGKVAVFNVKSDFSDLPNFNTHYYITEVKKVSGAYKVTFSRPLLCNYPAGTSVRLHREAGILNAIAFVQPQKKWETHKALIEKVSTDPAINEHFWPGTRFVKLNFYLYPGEAMLVNNLSLTPKKIAAADNLAEYEYRGVKLLKAFKPQHVVSSDKTSGKWQCKIQSMGILYGNELNWDAEKIKQLEVKFAAHGSPGYMMMMFDYIVDGKKHTSTMRHSVHPDGKEHTLLFRTGKENSWQGTIKSIRFYYYALDPAEISFNSIYGRNSENLIPDAENAPVGKAFSPGTLWPRGKYTLEWNGTENPGVKLEFLDRNFREIEQITLPANHIGKITFTMPEMAADAQITVQKSGAGYPVIRQLLWQERHQMPITWNGHWIWSNQGPGPEHSVVWLRKTITLDSEVEAAVAALSVDDKFKLYINGMLVGNGWPYFVTFKFDIAKYLRKGNNEIVIEAYNGETWGGALLEGYIRTRKSEINFCTDNSWDYAIGGTTLPEKYSGKAVSLGHAVTAFPWGNRITLRYIGKAAELEIMSSKQNTFTGKVHTVPPVQRDRMRMKAVTESGRSWYINPRIKTVSGKWQNNDIITIEYAQPYPENEPYTLYCADDFFSIKNNVALGRVAAYSGAIKPLSTVKIKNTDSRPQLDVNGKSIYPLFWQFPQRYNTESYQPTLGDSLFAASGITGILIYIEESLQPDGSYDFSKIYERVAVMLNENPDSLIMFCAYLYMPEWWLKKFPDNRGLDRNGKPLRGGYNTALASYKWREYVDDFMKALVKYAARQTWGHKVIGVSLFESSNSEWFWEPGGYSPADLEAFRKHIQRKYSSVNALQKAWNNTKITFDNLQHPSVRQIKAGTVGALLSPLKDQYLIDWFEFRNVIFAEQIIAFAKSVKEASGNKWLAGAYYGYFMECAASSRSLQDHGHNGFLEAARSPYVDFVRAPSRYIMRKLGMADGIMQLPDSFKLRNKLVYIEQDFRSYTANEKEGHHGKHNIPIDTVGALNRAFGMMLASGCSQYILDFGRWLYEPMLLDILREQAGIFRQLPPVKGTTPYEFAVAGCRDSAYYAQKNGQFTIVDGVTASFMRKINHLPLPFRQVALEDLTEPGLVPPLKFYVILAPVMMTKEQRKQLMERFDREHATVLFLHSAGETYPDKSPSADNCGDFLNIKMAMDMKLQAPQMFYGQDKTWNNNQATAPHFYPVSGFDEVLGRDAANRPMLVRKKIGNATVYFATQLSLPLDLISTLAKTAKVHHYSNLSSDVWWIGNDIVMLYAASDGEKSVILPNGCFMEQIAGPRLPRKRYNSQEKFSARSGQAYIFIVRNTK